MSVFFSPKTGWWFQIFLIFIAKSGEDEPILTNVFQMGWFNHQPEKDTWVVFFCMQKKREHLDFGIPKNPVFSSHMAFEPVKSCMEPFTFWFVLKIRVSVICDGYGG